MDVTVSLDDTFETGSILELPPGAELVRIKRIGSNGLPELMEIWDGERYVERVPQIEVLGVINGPVGLKLGPNAAEFCL